MPIDSDPLESARPVWWRTFRPLRVDLYIFGEVLGPFLGGIAFFVFIFLMFQALRLADFLILRGVAGGTLLKMTGLLMLSFLPIALPVAFLISVLVGFGRLSGDSELVAMKASGFGLVRLSAAPALLSVGVVALSLFLNLEAVPWGERTFKSLLIRVGNTKVVSEIHEGTFTTGFFDLLIFADKVDPKTSQLKHVFIYDEREPKNPLTVVAQSGEVLPVRMQSELGAAAVLKLYNGSIHRNDIAQGSYSKIDFQEYRLFLKVDEGALTSVLKPQQIPYHDLVEKIRNTKPTEFYGLEFRGEYWRRISIALTPFLFVFLGIGFGTVRTRAVRAGAALVAFLVLVVYWAIQTAGTIAVQRALMPPFIAMELPNLFVFVLGAISFRKSMW